MFLKSSIYHSLTLAPTAARNPGRLNESSLAEQRARPPITGRRERFTYRPERKKDQMAKIYKSGIPQKAPHNIC